MKTGEIIEALEMLSPYGEEELLSYLTLINAEMEDVEKHITEEGRNNPQRVIMLAAARINYKIALIKQSSDKVTHFTAGDVSITEGSEALENAKRLLDELTAQCTELISTDGFVFKSV